MKNVLLSAMVLAGAAGLASADTYADASDDIFDLGFSHLDISSVSVSNDATWLYFTIQTAGDLDATNWGKYGIGIDTGNKAGFNTNGWNRPIDWGRDITHWAGTWADDGGSGAGGQIWTVNSNTGGWVMRDATYDAATGIQGNDSLHFAGIQQIQLSLAVLGLQAGDTIDFDVISSGGGDGDGGVDHLSNPGLAMGTWGDTSVSGAFSSYTIVPSPASAALLGLGGLVGLRRRR